MNERLKQIMLEHGLHKHISEDCQHRMEMLYELIMRECIKEMEEFVIPTEEFTQWNKAINHSTKYLKDHFGVDK